MTYLDTTRAARPPYSPASGAPGQHTFQRLAGATTVEGHNSRPLKQGQLHTLVVGATPVRIEFRGEAGLVGVVSGTVSLRLPAGATLNFVPQLSKKSDGTVEYGSIHLYAEDDAASAGSWEVFVYPSGL